MRVTLIPRALGVAAVALALALAAPGLAPVLARDVRPAKTAAPLAGLDGHVARVMRELDVPGVAVAVVKDGRVLLAKGYGVKRLGDPAPVDSDTRFGIASNTKAFTCAALSILADEGRLSWDDPVTRHLPEFHLHDPWATREVTLRDLVTHRAGLGLGQGDLMWWPPTDFTRREIVRGMAHLRPATSLRSRYAYNNVAFVAAGEVVAAVSGRSWDDFVRERLLGPLGMTRTTVGGPAGDGALATPHIRRQGATVPVVPAGFDNAAAAAGLRSTAGDMARWVAMLLECGRPGGPSAGAACVVKPESVQRMWSAQTVQPTPEPPPGLEALRAGFAAYGLGFGLRDYRGHKLASHTGGLPGYVSRVTLVPDARLGVVVLTNQEDTVAFDAITYVVLDGFLGAPDPPVDWLAAFRRRAEEEQRKAQEAVAKARAARSEETRSTLPLARYAGRYRDPWYGEVTVGEEGGRLVLAMTRTPGMVADLEPWQHDTFVARWREAFMSDSAPADAYVSFAFRPDLSVERVTLAPVSPAIDFSFDFQDLALTPVPAAAK
jgi:CubicO group peptidase (beta-lactamase class C family)